ncbi:ATP-binding protein [Aquiflexum sp.]|uniref:sensor histidine kinase n=1 Tax=Aquiflexum sp. TaxID=1872584 RepID=UPI0035939EAA
MANAKNEKGYRQFEDLRWRYLFALSAIALTIIISQAILQYYISQQVSDSIEVNLSGRQRMLSQRITKSAILLLSTEDSLSCKNYLAELKQSLQEWKRAHEALQVGDQGLGVRGTNNKTIQGLFAEIQPNFEAMVSGGERLVEGFQYGTDDVSDSQALSSILINEPGFLKGMDEIVFQFDRQAQAKVARLRKTEIILLAVALFLIFIEVRFIFWPSAKLIKQNFQQLAEKEANSRNMALEITSLYDSLEKSYLELAEAEVEVEDLTLFANCSATGDFQYFSERFCEVMEFGADKPGNFFGWLENQGYNAKYVHKIQDLVSQGKTWEGDLKLVNEEGDFVWLKLHLVPVLGQQEQVEGLMLISVDETEVKEAQAKSQEIHKEKLEKKLKEQQYRSALILEGQEEERRRISRDLHDGIGQYLTALKYSLDGINEVKSYPEEKRLEVSKRLIGDVIKEVRRISFHLTPVALSDYGLTSVLNKFSEEMTKISKIPVVFENPTGFMSRLEAKVENNIYRIVQEAVNNAIKYSEATEIKISLSHNSKYLYLQVSDNGKGFDYNKLKEDGHFSASGHGIFNIKERVNFINGQFQMETSPGMGTIIHIELPLES